MKRIRGLGDIRTHGSLSREGTLTSVARDWHRLRGLGGGTDDAASKSSWDGKVDNSVYKKVTARLPRRAGSIAPLTNVSNSRLQLLERIRRQQIASTQSLLEELRQALAEGIPVASSELRRLEARLFQLNNQ